MFIFLGAAVVVIACDMAKFLSSLPPLSFKKWNEVIDKDRDGPPRPAGQVEEPTIIYDMHFNVVAVFTTDYVPLEEVRCS